MLFSGIPFLFYFLPAVAVVYFLLPNKLRNACLLLASLVFYAWGEPKYVLLMIFAIIMFYAFGLGVEKCRGQRVKKVVLAFSIIAGVSFLAVFKYADFVLENWNRLTGMGVGLLKVALPIGISFYTFQCISYVVDVYRGQVKAQKNIIDFGAYVALFPQLIAGPIVRYVDVEKELSHRKTTWEDLGQGVFGFLVGLGKKVLIANALGELTEVFRSAPGKSVVFYWLYAVAFMLHIYFDFSGYSDMAIGLGRIFGFHFPRNFDYPYISKSVTEFWRRWHMTLGGWFRDYVYIPLGGNRVSRGRWFLNILVVWMLTGLWHGAAWNFVVWGLFFAALLLLEKWLPLDKLPVLLRRGYVLLAVMVSFVIFNAQDMTQAGQDLLGLVGGLPIPWVTAETVYYLKSYGFILALAVVGATPVVHNLALGLSRRESIAGVLKLGVSIVLLLICTAYLVDGSFNPFLYFRF